MPCCDRCAAAVAVGGILPVAHIRGGWAHRLTALPAAAGAADGAKCSCAGSVMLRMLRVLRGSESGRSAHVVEMQQQVRR